MYLTVNSDENTITLHIQVDGLEKTIPKEVIKNGKITLVFYVKRERDISTGKNLIEIKRSLYIINDTIYDTYINNETLYFDSVGWFVKAKVTSWNYVL